MNITEFIKFIQDIVEKSNTLKNKYTDEINAPVNYCCIFSQSTIEFENLVLLASKIWTILEETTTGPIFKIEPIKTKSWELKILKIRKHDKEHPEIWDADFTVSNYPSFKDKYLEKKEFTLIERQWFEMIELMEKDAPVRCYFSFPTLLEKYKISP